MRTKSTFATLLLVFLTPFVGAAQVYTITDLGSLRPTAINSWAQIVGNQNNQAYLWAFGHLRPLGTLAGGTFSQGAAINDLGVITGSADAPGSVTYPDGTTQSCADLVQPFLWTLRSGIQAVGAVPGIRALEGFDLPCPDYEVSAINNQNQVVGTNDDIATYEYGFVWSRSKGWTQFEDGYQTTASGINDSGSAVGQIAAGLIPELTHAALWVNGTGTDLGTLGGDSNNFLYCSAANSINNSSQVVGWSTFGISAGYCFDPELSPLHAFIWTSSTGMQDLGTLPGDTSSVAVKINLVGQVVGSSGSQVTVANTDGAIQVVGRPFIWSARNGMQDLNALIPSNSGWVLNSASDINFWGQIIGMGELNGQPHGYLLTPKNPFQH